MNRYPSISVLKTLWECARCKWLWCWLNGWTLVSEYIGSNFLLTCPVSSLLLWDSRWQAGHSIRPASKWCPDIHVPCPRYFLCKHLICIYLMYTTGLIMCVISRVVLSLTPGLFVLFLSGTLRQLIIGPAWYHIEVLLHYFVRYLNVTISQ